MSTSQSSVCLACHKESDKQPVRRYDPLVGVFMVGVWLVVGGRKGYCSFCGRSRAAEPRKAKASTTSLCLTGVDPRAATLLPASVVVARSDGPNSRKKRCIPH
eukprot:PhM_4_TR8797/c2_g1_i15/m.102392